MRLEFIDYTNNSLNNNKRFVSHVYSYFSNENYFDKKRQIIETFESCQLHDQIINKLKCFLE